MDEPRDVPGPLVGSGRLSTEGAPPPRRGRVLIADDEPALLEIFLETLQQAGFETATASNGREAMQRFDEGGVDLVLSDIDMPGMNGIQLLRAVRARDLDVPVILVTGNPRLETAMAAIEQGALQYIPK